MPARVPMSERQRQELLALPDTEDEVIRHHSLDAADMAAVAPVLFPEMTKRGQKPSEMVALLASAGAMSETIPPSVQCPIVGD